MKNLFVILLTISALPLYAQEITADREIAMSETNARYHKGVWTYFEKGKQEPYTGILFAKYNNGNWESRQEYEHGIGNGTWINYYEDGTLKEVGTYVQNRVEGPIKKYYPNGQLKAEGQYREWRIRIGSWKYYNEAGECIAIIDHGSKGDYRDVEAYRKDGSISKKEYEYLLKN